jgi:hypothetical protein
VNVPCASCIVNGKWILRVEKRLDQLEKFIPVLKKYRSKTPVVNMIKENDSAWLKISFIKSSRH